MEKLISSENGSTVMLAGLIIILCLHLVMKIVEMGFSNFKKKSELTDQLSTNVREISTRISALERDLNEILKFKQDFRRLFTAVKHLSGDRWGDIRKAIMEDDLSSIGE